MEVQSFIYTVILRVIQFR